MGKIVALIRTSTDKQQTEDQRNEMIEYCQSLGYGKTDIVIIENQGASAIKMDEKYMGMIAKLKSEILENHAEAVGVWMLDRLGRNEVMLMELKNFFIDNKIQLYIKNPSLSLLNTDGTVNNGAELAISLFITMSKQEMMEKQSRFKRRKKVMSEQCLYTGGPVKFGYKVEDGKVVVNEDEAQLIRMIFTMFATGKYSINKLCKELKERGITRADGKLSKIWMTNVLLDTAYIGRVDSDTKKTHRNYIPIISKEVFNECQRIKKGNDGFQDKSIKHIVLGRKIVKCPDCGSNFIVTAKLMKCWRHCVGYIAHEDEQCPNNINIPIDVADGLIWRVAATEYMDWLMNDKDIQIKELEEQKKITVQKINALKKKIEDVDKERKKVGSAWLDNLITDEEKEKRLSKIEVRNKEDKAVLAKMTLNIDRINELLKAAGNNDEIERWADIAVGVVEEKSLKTMYEIAHRFIKSLIPERVVIPELLIKKILKITIETYTGRKEVFYMLFNHQHTVYKYIDGQYKVFDFDKIGRD